MTLVKRNNYSGIANALEDNYKNKRIFKDDLRKLLGKDAQTQLNYAYIVECINKTLEDNGLILKSHRGYYTLQEQLYPEQKEELKLKEAAAIKALEEPDEAAPVKGASPEKEAVEHSPEERLTLKLGEVIDELKRRPEKISAFNEIIAPLGKKIEVVGVKLVLI